MCSGLRFYVKDYVKVYKLLSGSWGCWISDTDMEVIFFHTTFTLMLTQSNCSLMLLCPREERGIKIVVVH